MKSIAGFFCFVSIISSTAYGETIIFGKPYAISGIASTGFLYGTSYEIVYLDNRSSEKLSELQWELKPLFYMGMGLSLEPVNSGSHYRGFFAELGIKAGLPAVTGTMEDRDWQIPETLTNFSSHTNNLKAAILLTMDAGYSFSITDRFFFRFFGSLDYFFFRMEARNGFYCYADNNWEKKEISGTVIKYTQHWFLFSPGLSAGFILDRLTIKGAVKITPFILCVDKDDHLLTSTRYIDYMIGKYAIKPSLDLSYNVNPRLEAGFAYSYQYITGTRGDMVIEKYRNSGSAYTIPNATGAGLWFFESSIYLKFVL